MNLIMHIIFGLLIYPVALVCFVLQDTFTFRIFGGLARWFLLTPIIYWGLRIGVVVLWIYLGVRISDGLGLMSPASNAMHQLSTLYLFAWFAAVIMLVIKAHWRSEEISAKRDRDRRRTGQSME
jgi:hypothetical protein